MTKNQEQIINLLLILGINKKVSSINNQIKMAKVNLSEKTVSDIREFATKEQGVVLEHNPIQGMRLSALYRMIQEKGEPIESDDEKYNGIMALEFSKGEYIAIKVIGEKKGSFFPCAIRTIYLQAE